MLKSYELAVHPVHCSDKRSVVHWVEKFWQREILLCVFSWIIRVWVVLKKVTTVRQNLLKHRVVSFLIEIDGKCLSWYPSCRFVLPQTHFYLFIYLLTYLFIYYRVYFVYRGTRKIMQQKKSKEK